MANNIKRDWTGYTYANLTFGGVNTVLGPAEEHGYWRVQRHEDSIEFDVPTRALEMVERGAGHSRSA